jgi:histidinol-phosphate/aromatic aminotransferase/cobyric acid decarboxylase-like protein
MSVPRNLQGAVRIHVGDPKQNERLLKTLRDLVA